MAGQISITLDEALVRLSNSTADALTDARMDDAMRILMERVVNSDRFVEVGTTSCGESIMRLCPYAELVLIEARDTAKSRLTKTGKTSRVKRVVELGGF